MSYVDAYHNRDEDLIYIVERAAGKRIFHTVKPEYSFYYPDARGKFISTQGEKLSKFETSNSKIFNKEKHRFQDRCEIFESDIKPVFKALEKIYAAKVEVPVLNTAPVDIEVGFCQKRGFAPPDDPHQPITAITVNLDWEGKLITLSVAPKQMTADESDAIAAKFDNCFIFEREEDMLLAFLDIIEDVDILYTWNGEGFDIPYIVNRITRILGKEYTRKLSLWDAYPKKREFERYGKAQTTYDIIGRVHLDYLQLYRKYTYHEMHSYRLDAIAEYELGDTKTPYTGTLDQLYNNDYEKFIEYNRQDVILLSKMESKLKFIQLTNTLAHENCVLLSTTMGAVALTDQAIILESHRRGFIVPDRKRNDAEVTIAGGYVNINKQGLVSWLGSVDINSLYPSAIRALNMSPETLIGHIEHTLTRPHIDKLMKNEDQSFADAWGDLFCSLEFTEVINQTDTALTVWLEKERQTVEMTAKEVYDWIYDDNSNLCISANGTIFKTDVEGIIPGLLESWYADRKMMQAKKKEYAELLEKETDPDKRAEYKYQMDFWDQRQLSKKIQLNSLYGAVSNIASRFADQRIGQSTTLTGRTITKHMNAKANEILTGVYDNLGSCIVYSDTDSAYFSVSPVLESLSEQGFQITKDSFVDLANSIADEINESFPGFVEGTFHINSRRSSYIKCGREICGERGLFVKKKRYAVLYYDQENSRKDKDGMPGLLKIMGMDTQRADTPKTIQEFLKQVLTKVLAGNSEDSVLDFIRVFKKSMKDLPAWEKGTPKRVNNLTDYKQRVASKAKVTVPGHVRASLNWNSLRSMNNDRHSMEIMDGQKIIVCKLRPNPLGMTSVAYPIDEFNLPKWFTSLPFDPEEMEAKLIDQKLDNIIGSLNWNIESTNVSAGFGKLFSFE